MQYCAKVLSPPQFLKKLIIIFQESLAFGNKGFLFHFISFPIQFLYLTVESFLFV